MVDMLAIMLVTGGCLYVAIRAMMLDRMLPWFTARAEPESEPVAEAAPAAATARWRSRTTEPSARSIRPTGR